MAEVLVEQNVPVTFCGVDVTTSLATTSTLISFTPSYSALGDISSTLVSDCLTVLSVEK